MMNLKGSRKLKPASNNVLSHCAFTLAEVLITIGIIGVVAALTIPTLMNKLEGIQEKEALKKGISVLSQSYLFAQNENGGSIQNLCTTNNSTCLATLFKPYLKPIKEVSGIPNDNNLAECWDSTELFYPTEPKVCYVMSDGTSIVFDMEYQNCVSYCGIIAIDVNGLKKPNKWGKDRYELYLYNTGVKPTSVGGCANGESGGYNENRRCAYDYLTK